MKSFILPVMVFAALLAGGCTAVQPFRGLSMSGDSLYVSGLPPLRQNREYACGPACLAAVAAHWGVGLAEFKARYPAVSRDTTGPELRAIAASLGLRALVYQGSMADLRKHLHQGRPVIVMIQQPPDQALRQTGLIGAFALAVSERVPHPAHWVVVIGITADDRVIVHDPAGGPLQIEAGVFQKWWRRMENLCVLVVPG